jgi:hypothetical protein
LENKGKSRQGYPQDITCGKEQGKEGSNIFKMLARSLPKDIDFIMSSSYVRAPYVVIPTTKYIASLLANAFLVSLSMETMISCL